MNKPLRLVGYGVGDFGLNIYWHSLSMVLVFWYAEVVGLDPKYAGWLYFLGLAWDAISDPIIAFIASKNNSKYGTYRPFILFGSFLLGLSFCFLFWVPPLEGWPLFYSLLFAAIIFRTCYTIVAVPYSALSSRLTFSSKERSELSGVRMMFAFCGMLFVTKFLFPDDTAGMDQDASNFYGIIMISAVLATCALVTCFALTRESPPIGKQNAPATSYFSAYADSFKNNGALKILLIILFLNSASGASMLIPLAFYLESFSGQFADKEVIMPLYALATLAGTPIWTIIARNLGKKNCWYMATVWMTIIGLSLFLIGPVIINGIPAQIVLMGFGGSAFAVIIWAIIPDTVEYGQYAYGRRDEGVIFGSSLFVQKASGAFTGLLVGYVLSGIGYNPDLSVQTSETATKLSSFISLVPAILLIIASFAFHKMPLSRNVHDQIVDKLSR